MQTLQKKPTKTPKRYNVMGPVAHQFNSSNTGSWRLERPQVDFASCIKCGTCAMYCPANVIAVRKDQSACIEIMWDYCKGCGICANECPKHCIQMVDEQEGK